MCSPAVLFVMLLVVISPAVAQRNALKPQDFKPLTELPWKKEGTTLPPVLQAIFLETNEEIRHLVLEEYLHKIPAQELGAAFDQCMVLEGTQTPDELVSMVLRIWAARDPDSCWQNTKGLFKVVGIEQGWLGFDSWGGRRRVEVRDWDAIKASKYWLRRESLLGFMEGVKTAALASEARKSLKQEFSLTWFRAFDGWPPESVTQLDDKLRQRIIEAYLTDRSELPALVERQKWLADVPVFEVAVRRWLTSDPAKGLEIIKLVMEKNWFADATVTRETPNGPSLELLMLWADLDLPATIRWADSLDPEAGRSIALARGMLMGRVEAATRKRWLAQAEAADAKRERPFEDLLSQWAAWEPLPALEAVLAMKEDEMVEGVLLYAAFGPWWIRPRNTCHFGVGVIKSFDLSRLPKDVLNNEWAGLVQEAWGEIDIGECARFGVEYMVKYGFVPRENLIKLFSGDDDFASDGDVIDRTFCCLRVWAVVRPDEMKAWIASLKDADMRTALTWLVEHPWGTGGVE